MHALCVFCIMPSRNICLIANVIPSPELYSDKELLLLHVSNTFQYYWWHRNLELRMITLLDEKCIIILVFQTIFPMLLTLICPWHCPLKSMMLYQPQICLKPVTRGARSTDTKPNTRSTPLSVIHHKIKYYKSGIRGARSTETKPMIHALIKLINLNL